MKIGICNIAAPPVTRSHGQFLTLLKVKKILAYNPVDGNKKFYAILIGFPPDNFLWLGNYSTADNVNHCTELSEWTRASFLINLPYHMWQFADNRLQMHPVGKLPLVNLHFNISTDKNILTGSSLDEEKPLCVFPFLISGVQWTCFWSIFFTDDIAIFVFFLIITQQQQP